MVPSLFSVVDTSITDTITLNALGQISTVDINPYLITNTYVPQIYPEYASPFNKHPLEDRISTVERILGIPERDLDLEREHPLLTEMFNEHLDLIRKAVGSSADIQGSLQKYHTQIEKYKLWTTLKL